MPGASGRSGRRSDALTLATLVATGLVITLPFFARHGHWTYLDNAVHLAESYSLINSATGGWSEIAFCGFPLGTLHSPLWYETLAAVGRLGMRIEPFYAVALLAGLLAPPIALYVIARRTVSPLVAALVSYALLVRRSAIIGPAAALAGMWTFYLAAAALYLLIDRLARRERTTLDVAVNAALIGFIGLTHLFALIALAILGGIHLLRSIVGADRARRLKYDVAAGVLGLLASARYWLAAWLDTSWTPIPVHNRSAGLVLESLVLSPPLDGLPHSWRALASQPMTAVDLATQLFLLGIGVCGAWFLLRRRPDDDRAVYGLTLAAVILTLLVGVLPRTGLAVLGPISWRFVYFVVQGLTLASLPWLASLRGRWTILSPRAAIAVAVSAIVVATIFGRPLWQRLATDDEIDEVQQLWSWLREHRTDAWGRTYVQDMDSRHTTDNLMPTGLLALTAHQSGVRQLGNYYGIVPFPTVHWTRSDRHILYGEPIEHLKKVDHVVEAMALTNATHLVTSDSLAAHLLGLDSRFVTLYRVGRFTVFEARPNESRWAAGRTSGLSIDDIDYAAGRIRMQVTTGQSHGGVLVKEAFDPQWRVQGAEGTLLKPEEHGLMVVANIPSGTHALDLRYRPSAVPVALTLFGWLAILMLAGVAAMRALRDRTVRVVRPAPAV